MNPLTPTLRLGLTLVGSLVLTVGETCARTWLVNPDGTGDAPTIQAAVDSAAVSDTVLLTAGTFTGAGNKNVLLRGRDIVLESQDGAAATFVDCEGDGRALLSILGETAATFVRGITFRNGNPTTGGGAILIVNGSPTVTTCVFENNNAPGSVPGGGGAILCEGAGSRIANCTFIGNANPSLEGIGGAISVQQSSGVRIVGCAFSENTTSESSLAAGGAVFVWFGSDLTVRNCTFEDNSSRAAGAIGIAGTTDAVIDHCVFTQNAAILGGGLNSTAPQLLVLDCDFIENRAQTAGGAEVSSFGSQFVRCRFERNRATGFGGAIAGFVGDFAARECVFVGNRAPDASAVFAREGDVLVANCTFYRNENEGGGVISVDVGNVATVENSIFSSNRGVPAICAPGSAALFSCCDLVGNTEGDWVGCLDGQGVIERNFSADPLFCDATDGDFSLQASSPCAPPGEEGCGLVGALPVGCGAISIGATSWGRIKGLYRE